MHFVATEKWSSVCPGATVACLVVAGVVNQDRSLVLDSRLDEIEHELRARYAGFDRASLRASEPFAAYDRYYKRFGQTYHVQHQVESVALKGKPIPRRAPVVEAAFAEELFSGLLTAMHDADAIGSRVSVGVAQGDEMVDAYNGKRVQLDAGDMFMRDERNVLTSVVRGPAAYGMVTPETTRVVVCVYAPEGVETGAVRTHLERIAENLRLSSPSAETELLEIISA